MVQKRDNLKLDIIELLVKKENHVRGMAKKLNVSHSTILRRLNELVNIKVLDFRTEGKNKVFFIKKNINSKIYVLKSELNKLIKLITKYPELSIIFEEILKKIDARLIVLFGSYAKETASKKSDIDIYIETNDRNIKNQVESINSNINVKIGRFDKKSLLIREIIKDHVILKGMEYFYEKQFS